MRKVCAAILSTAICLAVSGAPAWASEQQATLSAGYLHARTNAPGSDNLNGINVKYRYEFTDTLGLITSFSYANAEDEQKTHYSDTRWHEDSVRNRWFSVMAGPSVRVNEWFSAYAMAGVAYSRVSTFSGDYLQVKDTEAEKLFRIREAEETKNNLMQVASEHIAPLQDAADLEIATEEEISLLEAWKKYRVLLNRVDTSTAQDIEWPALP
ncbi:Ail/Lom family outer membrane beta-barrel protein [Escherichia coli]|uniref:Ail/Lom family outer membrane beta-barrel protein n=15 Tax=Enterobacteriaceae TaxID=543 RepID=UPI0009077BB6|nr:Ail/Lom family outer membrane beta-barrel protein [Escherichia coli]EFA9629666.1 Ail/Lom family outer membrane beta-barrel protein [Escherichia coli]EGF7357138.1 Ail/Lom family outer membrane beta-barrel protein [Escherichia coli]EGO7643274.1 outer membrane beta-barrel protein [Escherichia coli]EGO8631255.1 hypothetical protein [Escherichia coli]MBS8740686.1 Ail/Lom family outer membrane beta-barrel protein [Escherichia coli]